MTTSPLAWVSLCEKEPDRELVQSDRRADYLRIMKNEEDFNLDSWIQTRLMEKRETR